MSRAGGARRAGGPAPAVSVGMPLYDCEATLETSIRSILGQTLEDWELLLVCDPSTDRTLEIARSFHDPRVRVLADGVARGLPGSLNLAIDRGAGRHFARMDADDVAYPARLERQVRFLDEHPEVDLVGCGVVVFGDEGRVLGTRLAPGTHEAICGRPWAGFPLVHPTWMGKMEWFRAHRYRQDLGRAEDQELLLRSHEESRFACLPEVLLGYRERSLPLGKMLGGRIVLSRAVMRQLAARGRPLAALRGALEQAAKGLVDAIAVTTGLDHRLLRHRARPARPEEVRRWEEVWLEAQREPAAPRAGGGR